MFVKEMNHSFARASAVAVILGLVACSEPKGAEQGGAMETRRYRATDIFLAGGGAPEQQQLHRAYEQAVAEARESADPESVPVFRKTFEACGIEFTEGASVIFFAADTHLYFRHTSKTLDSIEERFGLERVAMPEVDSFDAVDENPFAPPEQVGDAASPAADGNVRSR